MAELQQTFHGTDEGVPQFNTQPIPVPDATKPDDLDEDAPMEILDEEVEKLERCLHSVTKETLDTLSYVKYVFDALYKIADLPILGGHKIKVMVIQLSRY
ncbi:hypothetical protein Tco_1464315 [Tanacetum coccineum]